MSVEKLTKRFDSEETCIAYLEGMRWPEGVRCLKCNNDGISRFQARGKTGKIRHLYQCVSCRYQFSVTTGTIFHDSHIPLRKWFLAMALLGESKEGISTNQLGRKLGVQYKSACHLVDRIREALREEKEENRDDTAEVNGSYIGEGYGRRKERPLWEKRAFLGLLEGGGRIEAKSLPIPGRSPRKTHRPETVIPADLESLRAEAYYGATSKFWSLFKRGLTGSFAIASVPVVSVKHLPGFMNDLTRVFGSSFLSVLPTGIFRPAAKRNAS